MVDSRQVRLALRELRTSKNMTPEEFADAGTVSRATVYRIEDFETKYAPKVSTVSALLEGVGLTLAEFFGKLEGAAFAAPATSDERGQGSVPALALALVTIIDQLIVSRVGPSTPPASGGKTALTLYVSPHLHQVVRVLAQGIEPGSTPALSETTPRRLMDPTESQEKQG